MLRSPSLLPSSARALRTRRAAVLLCAALLPTLAACFRPRPVEISAAAVQRDRAARSDLSAAIDEDHRALADLIAEDRFSEVESIYRDPELREIALRLVERTRALGGLDDTDVLAPSVP